jgi:hypothetical protein
MFLTRFVLAQAFVDDLTQQIVLGPGQEFDLGDATSSASEFWEIVGMR